MTSDSTTNLVSLKKVAEDKTQTAIGIKKITDYALDPRNISIEPGFNARDMVNMSVELRAHIDCLKAAIRAGAKMPALDVRVAGDKIYVVDGHCRLTAYMELIAEGVEILFVSVCQFNGNDEDRDFHVLNSASQLHLTRLEQGRIYKRRMGYGWSVSQIAERAQKSASFVEQNLMLYNANNDVHQMLVSEQVSAKVALDAIRAHGEKAGAFLAAKLLKATGEGKTKLTDKVVNGRAFPRKIAAQVSETLSGLFDENSSIIRARIVEADDDAAISVPAVHLKVLLAAHDAIHKGAQKETA